MVKGQVPSFDGILARYHFQKEAIKWKFNNFQGVAAWKCVNESLIPVPVIWWAFSNLANIKRNWTVYLACFVVVITSLKMQPMQFLHVCDMTDNWTQCWQIIVGDFGRILNFQLIYKKLCFNEQHHHGPFVSAGWSFWLTGIYDEGANEFPTEWVLTGSWSVGFYSSEKKTSKLVLNCKEKCGKQWLTEEPPLSDHLSKKRKH